MASYGPLVADDTFEYSGDGYAELFSLCVAEFYRRRGFVPSEELLRRSITARR